MARSKRNVALYVIAYDISNDRRRTKVHKILSAFGEWTQFSLFECFLTPKQLLQLKHRLDQHLNPEEDSVRFYYICERCAAKAKTVGSSPPQEKQLFLI